MKRISISFSDGRIYIHIARIMSYGLKSTLVRRLAIDEARQLRLDLAGALMKATKLAPKKKWKSERPKDR